MCLHSTRQGWTNNRILIRRDPPIQSWTYKILQNDRYSRRSILYCFQFLELVLVLRNFLGKFFILMHYSCNSFRYSQLLELEMVFLTKTSLRHVSVSLKNKVFLFLFQLSYPFLLQLRRNMTGILQNDPMTTAMAWDILSKEVSR